MEAKPLWQYSISVKKYCINMEHVHHIHFSSSQRTSGTSSRFNIELSIPPLKFNRVAIVKAAIPRSWYLIAAPWNTLVLQEGLQSVTVTVPPGNYSLNNWVSAIPPLLTAASPNGWVYTAVRVSLTGTITWSVAGNGGVQPSFVITEMSQQMCLPVGTNTFVGNSLVGNIPYSATGILGLQICSDIASAHTNVLSEIFSVGTVEPGAVMVSELQDIKASSINYRNIPGTTSFNIYLRNPHSGRDIDLNGHDWLGHLIFWRDTVEPTTEAPKIPETLVTKA